MGAFATAASIAGIAAGLAPAAPASQLPVVGCKTEDAVGAGIPVIPGYLPRHAESPIGLSAQLAAKLAWYEGDIKKEVGFKVLAPRGWDCFALIGADGNWGLTVTPAGAKPGIEVEISAYYNGVGASTACNYFPAAR